MTSSRSAEEPTGDRLDAYRDLLALFDIGDLGFGPQADVTDLWDSRILRIRVIAAIRHDLCESLDPQGHRLTETLDSFDRHGGARSAEIVVIRSRSEKACVRATS